ncbi:radical SAM/SPASM domain-containing protein [Anaerorhabdus sp.]|jgi:radical SAM protein with 4Fe4S-binding SPASM domain|uniref:radical SAM/SPASM domain-containing protein n=1 Tax=Anaerorhabdus sp. TaxID=1872524 RepID=UPI002FC65C51
MNKIKRIYIEITNKCNLRCKFCSFHHRPFHEMSLEEFETILLNIKHITPFIYLHVQGEPLIHTKFDEIMSLCDKHAMNVQLVTNGTYLANQPNLINHPSLRKISLSLHSLDYQNCDIEEYMKTILNFIHDFTNSKYGFAELRFWVSDNLNERANLALKMIKDNYQLKPTNKPNSYSLQERVYLHFENQFTWPSEENSDDLCGTCRGGKDMLAILADGTIVPCCLDAEGCINLGNIHTETITDVLFSERYLRMIKGFNENKLIEPLCKSCQYRKRFD